MDIIQNAGPNSIQIAGSVTNQKLIIVNAAVSFGDNAHITGTDIVIGGDILLISNTMINGQSVDIRRTHRNVRDMLAMAETAMRKHNFSLTYVPFLLQLWYAQTQNVATLGDETLYHKPVTKMTDDEHDQNLAMVDRVRQYVRDHQADFWTWVDHLRLKPETLLTVVIKR